MTPDNDNTKIEVMLARIETKQDNMHEDIGEIKINVKDMRIEFNGRVGKLEIKNGYLWGGLVVVGVIIPIVIKYVF